jgi:hypothetical protein
MNSDSDDVESANTEHTNQQASTSVSCSHGTPVGRQVEQIDYVIGGLSRYLPTSCYLLWPTRADRVQHHIRRN